MRLLFLGDIVGRPGRIAFIEKVPELRRGETRRRDRQRRERGTWFRHHGSDLQRSDRCRRGCRDARQPRLGPARGDVFHRARAAPRAPDQLSARNTGPWRRHGRGQQWRTHRGDQRHGRVFMDPLDDPFRMVDQPSARQPLGTVCDALVVDMHAEATRNRRSPGILMARRHSSSAHIPIRRRRSPASFLGGTAYQSDAGMSGNYDSVLGFQKPEPIRRFIEKTHIDQARGARRHRDPVRPCRRCR